MTAIEQATPTQLKWHREAQARRERMRRGNRPAPQPKPVAKPLFMSPSARAAILRKIEAIRQLELVRLAEANRAARLDGKAKGIDLATIESRICKALKVSQAEIRSPRRHHRIVFARQAFFYWAARLTNASYPKIGRFCGGRDHTTIMHGMNVYPAKRAAMGRTLRKVR